MFCLENCAERFALVAEIEANLAAIRNEVRCHCGRGWIEAFLTGPFIVIFPTAIGCDWVAALD